MNKVICDICGTVYQDTAENCPICGYAQFPDLELTEEDLLMEEPLLTRNKGGKYTQSVSKRKNKEIFDYDQVNPVPMSDEEEDEDEDAPDYEDDYDDDEEVEEAPRSNTALVIVLVVVIMLLLAAVGFVFFRFFLPTFTGNQEVTAAATEAIVTEATETEETTIPTVPRTDLILNEAPRHLSKEGQFYLLNVKVLPADTTDTLAYTSGDESVVTVTNGGRIVAVGEGETTVYITCGKMQINCPVIVKYEEESQPPTEQVLADEALRETEETEAAEETEPSQEASEVVLKLKYTDRSISVGYGFTLELDCDLDPSEVEWSIEHDHIASVDEKGFVTAKAKGTTAVIVKYGDQEVQCIIRCK